MNPDGLLRQLRSRGLPLLGVGLHRDPEILMVYLHGCTVQWATGRAVQMIETVPGVIAVTESVSSKTTVLVRIPSPRSEKPS